MNNDNFVHIAFAFDEDSYESVGALVMSSLETEDGWVMNLGCYYQICLRKDYFETLKLEQNGVVILGENKACKVHHIGTIILKMFDDYNVRYVP